MTANTYKKIVILTGAGLSAEFGLHTFRDKDGIWSKYDVRATWRRPRASGVIRSLC